MYMEKCFLATGARRRPVAERTGPLIAAHLVWGLRRMKVDRGLGTTGPARVQFISDYDREVGIPPGIPIPQHSSRDTPLTAGASSG